MKKLILPNKARGLHTKLLERLWQAQESIGSASKKDYIPFPIVFEKVCRNFSIEKQLAWECLFLLSEFGFIEVIKFKGIKLNYKIKNG